MTKTVLVGDDHVLREHVENFISCLFEANYGAKVAQFPSQRIARLDSDGHILCAAAVRTERDGFFSEAYLDAPIEEVLTQRSGRRVARRDVFEVSSLASRSPLATAAFLETIVAFGEDAGFAWSFFTLTGRLQFLVERQGLAPVHLADADRFRLADHARWGTYYDADPKVYAVARRQVRGRAGLLFCEAHRARAV